MSQSPRANKQTMNQPPTMTKAAVLLFVTVLDTTWRVFAPTLGGTILGITLDNKLHTAPLFTAIFIIVGIIVSALLIVQQLRSVRKTR